MTRRESNWHALPMILGQRVGRALLYSFNLLSIWKRDVCESVRENEKYSRIAAHRQEHWQSNEMSFTAIQFETNFISRYLFWLRWPVDFLVLDLLRNNFYFDARKFCLFSHTLVDQLRSFSPMLRLKFSIVTNVTWTPIAPQNLLFWINFLSKRTCYATFKRKNVCFYQKSNYNVSKN